MCQFTPFTKDSSTDVLFVHKITCFLVFSVAILEK